MAALRVLENSKTGRDFLQVHGMPASPGLTRSNYFDALASPRRLLVGSFYREVAVSCSYGARVLLS
jgi:hypothetical protein